MWPFTSKDSSSDLSDSELGYEDPPKFLFLSRMHEKYESIRDRTPRGLRICFKVVGYFFLAILFVLVFAFNLASAAASVALSALIYMIVGHAILRDAHLSGYDVPLLASVKVGAVGGAVLALPLAVVLSYLFPAEPETVDLDGFTRPSEGLANTSLTRAHLDKLVQLGMGTLVGAVAGPLGVRILRDHHYAGATLDALHAARAGALGGAILGPGILAAVVVAAALYKALPVEFGCWKVRSVQVSS